MKNIRLLSNVAMAFAAVVCLSVVVSDRLSTASAAPVKQTKWEYCYVYNYGETYIGNQKARKWESTTTITYTSLDLPKTEKFTLQDDNGGSASINTLSQAIAKLGNDGWELVGARTGQYHGTEYGDNNEQYLYFKRQQK